MMSVDRSTLPLRSIVFLLVWFSLPNPARSATLEDSAKEFSRRIASAIAAQGAQANVSCEVQNISSLRADEATRIEQAFKAELEERGIRLSASNDAESKLTLTLSQNWRDFVWTGSLRAGDTSETVVFAIPRAKNEKLSDSSRATLHSEKFWEGSEHILDVVQGTATDGKARTVLLLPDKLVTLEPAGRFEIPVGGTGERDAVGQLGSIDDAGTFWFARLVNNPPQICRVDLNAHAVLECLSKDEMNRPPGGGFPILIDLAPPGPAPAGKGTELVITPVCGGSSQFLATSDRDDTQTDSVQLFETETSGPVAMSSELDFPGPVLAMHSEFDITRAIVRNLITGNYEAYRLAISCAQ